MHVDETNGAVLRALLRTLRQGRRQREIAEAAGVSLSLYKKIESGSTRPTRLNNLLRVAEALEAQNHERATLIRLARPDLARLVTPEREERSVEVILGSLRSFADELLRSQSRQEAVHKAVELLYASFQPDQHAFAFERRAGGEMRMSISVGSELGPSPPSVIELPKRFPAVGLHVVDHNGGRIVYAPVRERGRRVAVLGLAGDRQRDLWPKCTIVIETVSCMLQMRLDADPSR